MRSAYYSDLCSKFMIENTILKMEYAEVRVFSISDKVGYFFMLYSCDWLYGYSRQPPAVMQISAFKVVSLFPVCLNRS